MHPAPLRIREQRLETPVDGVRHSVFGSDAAAAVGSRTAEPGDGTFIDRDEKRDGRVLPTMPTGKTRPPSRLADRKTAHVSTTHGCGQQAEWLPRRAAMGGLPIAPGGPALEVLSAGHDPGTERIAPPTPDGGGGRTVGLSGVRFRVDTATKGGDATVRFRRRGLIWPATAPPHPCVAGKKARLIGVQNGVAAGAVSAARSNDGRLGTQRRAHNRLNHPRVRGPTTRCGGRRMYITSQQLRRDDAPDRNSVLADQPLAER